MELQHNYDFKYVIQDINCIYFGRELSYAEMMDMDDVPFKFKAIISSYISRDTELDEKLTGHILKMTDREFSYRIYEQLKMTVRVCYREERKGFGGRTREKWVHRACPIKQFCGAYRDMVSAGDAVIEDISISKLALMGMSI